MEQAQYFIENLNSYSNLLVAILTIATVLFAYRESRSNQTSLRLGMLPIFFPKISVLSESTRLVLENTSNNPAYDVDLWVIGHYFQDEISYTSLLDKKFRHKIKISFSDGLYSYESKHYGIVDRISHYAFPASNKCTMDLDFKIPPEAVEIVLQFRDSGGSNYLYQCWLFAGTDKKVNKDFRLGHFVSSLRPAKRIGYQYPFPVHFIGWKHFVDIFNHTNHVFLPIRFFRLMPMFFEAIITMLRARLYLTKDIRDSLLRSFPSGYQNSNKEFDIEGRGLFTKI